MEKILYKKTYYSNNTEAWNPLRAKCHYKICEYFLCSFGLMAGQVAATIECLEKEAWGTGILQLYFFVATGIGALVRYRAKA